MKERTLILNRMEKSESFKKVLHHAKGQIELLGTSEEGFSLTVCLVELAEALDAERIHFDSEKDRIILYSLLGLNLNQIFSGKFPSPEETTSMQ